MENIFGQIPYRLLPLLLGVCLGMVPFLSAQSPLDNDDVRFEHIDISRGLIDSNVSSIIQDDQGILWFGTSSGLNSWDGYQFKDFVYTPFEEGSLPHNQIQTMYKDRHGFIWIGTYGGLSRLNPRTQEFTNFYADPDDDSSLSSALVISVFIDSKDRLWVGTGNGLNMSSDGGQNFTRFYEDNSNPRALSNKTIRSITEDEQGRIWIGHYAGISIWQEGWIGFQNIYHDPDAQKGLPGQYTMSFAYDADNRLFIGSWEGYVSMYDADNGHFTSHQLPTEGIYQLSFGSDGLLWIATWTGGLFALDTKTGEYQRFQHEEHNPYSLSHNLVYSLFEDDGGILWVGTRGGGINRFDPKKNRFQVYQRNNGQRSISPGEYTVLSPDSRGNLWLGTYSSGLDVLDLERGLVHNFSHDPDTPNSLQDVYIRDVFEDRMGRLWILTQSGLARYDYDSQSFVTIGAPFEEKILNHLMQDQQGNLWFGTYNNGIIRTDESFSSFDYFIHSESDPASISDNLVAQIYEDSAGNIWVGTNNGLDRWNGSGFDHYRYDAEDINTISGNKIVSIVEDQFGQLWIGTGSGGVNIYDPKRDGFNHFTTKDGLPSNTIVNLLPDEQNRMWIGTRRGMVIMDPEYRDLVLIDEDDGLLSSQINSAAAVAHDGSIFISTDEGVYRIPSLEYVNNSHEPNTVITGIEVSGREVIPHAEENLILNNEENLIIFHFAATDYSSPKKNRFRYRLVGHDLQWSNAHTSNQALFANLAPGSYVFEVRGSNNDGVWSQHPARFAFSVKPPWYLSVAALGSFTVFTLLFVFTAINFFHIRWQLHKRKLLEESKINKLLEHKVGERTAELREARQRAEDADQAKTRFLANISHDIRTPLNSIIGLSELLDQDENPKHIRQYNRTIQIESKKLLNLINEILDMSKIEAGKFQPHMTSFDLRELLETVSEAFHQQAVEKGLIFNVHIDPDLPNTIVSDRVSLTRIIENLLSNALKFTNIGSIRLFAEETIGQGGAQRIRFRVDDSGIGIPKEKQDQVFQSFEQLDKSLNRKFPGTGLGMSIANQLAQLLGNAPIMLESEPGKGSSFSFSIPLVRGNKAIQVDVDERPRTELQLSGHQILVVEDYEPNREVIKALLASSGAVIRTQATGAMALQDLEFNRYALIIMDLHMPDMDGLETSRRIRSFNTHTPILGITADVLESSREHCLASGMNDVIHKPIRREALIQAIHRLLSPQGTSPQPQAELPFEAPDIKDKFIAKFRKDEKPILDMDALIQEHDGDEEITRILIDGFLSSTDQLLNELPTDLQREQLSEIHRKAHSIKGGALNIFASELAQASAMLEGQAKQCIDQQAIGQDENTQTVSEKLTPALEDLESAFDRFRKTVLPSDSDASR